MSNLFKKVTSATMALLIVLSIVRPFAGVMAAYTTLEAANKLASLWVIVDNSTNPANYRLGDSITRGEMAKVTMKLSETEVADMCEGKYSDLAAADWACKYAEAGLANGYFAANATFRPMDVVTKVEALKMVMKARGIEKSSNSDWMAAYVEAGVEAGVLEAAFTDYNTVAQRGWIFQLAVNAIEGMADEGDDLLGDLLGDLDDEETETGTTTDTDTVVTGGTLLVSLSPETPAGATVPLGINGLPVVKFDLTAGDTDVTVTSITLKRKGLWDDNTLDNLAAFTTEGRASKGKDDSQWNDTEATLTLTNGLVVKAGETKTVSIVADITGDASDEFAIELKELVASASVETEGSLLWNTFRLGSVQAPELVIDTDTNVADVTLGAERTDIFKFKVQNDNTEDMLLKSITFRASDSSVEDNLVNFVLENNGEEVATVASMNGKYLTFTFEEGYTIVENKTEKFVVKADVIAWAGDEIEFYIDKELDVTAEGTKYGYWAAVDIAAVNNDGTPAGDVFDTIEIDAGELTLVDIDAPSDKIREDKDDVVLWTIKVTNVSWGSLELQEFWVLLQPSGITDLDTVFENYELYNEDTGASYELTLPSTYGTGNAVISDDDLNITLPQGTITFAIRADTKANITAFDTFTVALDMATWDLGASGWFYVVETDDDTEVDTITPSSLSWKDVDGTEASATVALVPLADTDAVRGSDDVVALQFNVEADESSAIKMDEATVKFTYADGATVATQSEIASVGLYKGSVSEANLLDRVSWSKLGSWDATFDGFSVEIGANATQWFVVTVTFVDWVDPVGDVFEAQLTWLSLEDDDSDDVTAATLPVPSNTVITGNTWNREITVTNAWDIVTLETKSSRADNEYTKSILAGSSKIVVSYDVRADNEWVDVETVTFDYSSGWLDLGAAWATATLYLNGTAIATNENADIDSDSITFEDLNLTIPETTAELKLMINTENVWQSLVWMVGEWLVITWVTLDDMEGESSGIAITAESDTSSAAAKTFDVVPATVVASVNSTFGTDDGISEFTLTYNDWENTTSAWDTFEVEFDTLTVEVSSFTATWTLTLFNGNGDQVGTVAIGGNWNVTMTLIAGETITDNSEKYRLESTAEASFRIVKNGVDYIVDGNTYSMLLQTVQELGKYVDSN